MKKKQVGVVLAAATLLLVVVAVVAPSVVVYGGGPMQTDSGRAAPVTSSEWALAGDSAIRSEAYIPAGQTVFAFQLSGSGTFEVYLLTMDGHQVAQLAKGHGPGQSEQRVEVPASDTYLIDVQATGEWELRVWSETPGGPIPTTKDRGGFVSASFQLMRCTPTYGWTYQIGSFSNGNSSAP